MTGESCCDGRCDWLLGAHSSPADSTPRASALSCWPSVWRAQPIESSVVVERWRRWVGGAVGEGEASRAGPCTPSRRNCWISQRAAVTGRAGIMAAE